MKKTKYLDLATELQNHSVHFVLNPSLWNRFKNVKGVDIKKIKWKETKYLNDKNIRLHDSINNINNRVGGIYLFVIKSNILPNTTEYLVYIGRAQLTNTHNLRIRVKKYIKEYISDKDRPKVGRMMNYWKNYLFLRYIELKDNDTIVEIEKRLINSLLPPFNDEIPDKKTRKAIKAFK